MNCPKCNWQGAYVGFTSVECQNPECTHYKKPEEKPKGVTLPPGKYIGSRGLKVFCDVRKAAEESESFADKMIAKEDRPRVMLTNDGPRRVPNYVKDATALYDDYLKPTVSGKRSLENIQSARRVQHLEGIKINTNMSPIMAFVDKMKREDKPFASEAFHHFEQDIIIGTKE